MIIQQNNIELLLINSRIAIKKSIHIVLSSYKNCYILIFLFGTLIGIFGSAQAAPSFAEVRAAYTESDAQLLADDGQVLASVRLDKTARRLPWTRIEDVSPAFLRALLAAEDRQFYAHSGVDWALRPLAHGVIYGPSARAVRALCRCSWLVCSMRSACVNKARDARSLKKYHKRQALCC